MKVEQIPFQQTALRSLRSKIESARKEYATDGTNQVVSYTAPTGAGKTIIMASLMENIFFGDADHVEQPEAIFVWLSDSPELNQQSRDKIDLKADRISLSQTVTITEEAFSQEVLDDGTIYFLNTQKLGKNSNLTKHSDRRQWTIWETLANTVRQKADRLYFIIDEAHRGARAGEMARATTIMQKFLKGSPEDGLPVMPLVIGISATSARFNRLVEGLDNTTIRKVTTSADEVRASGLLKDRIIIEYPDTLNNEMAVLQAATDEWQDKVLHWEQYCREQHYSYVDPVFVVQVQNGSGQKLSDTDLDACLTTIESRVHTKFKEYEVVHTFGQTAQTITVAGLPVHYEEPSRIADNRKIKVVFFKENLSTGWDCPRAETMMSFRRANDATYIAQLLGRMVRTPKQMHINVDETLNEVRLFLPFFNEETVKEVVDYLQSTEGSNIPTDVVGQQMGSKTVEALSVKNKPALRPAGIAVPKPVTTNDVTTAQQSVSTNQPTSEAEGKPEITTSTVSKIDGISSQDENPSIDFLQPSASQEKPITNFTVLQSTEEQSFSAESEVMQESTLDREEVIKSINMMGLLTYNVRKTRTYDYLRSLFRLSFFLTRKSIVSDILNTVRDEVVEKIRLYVISLKAKGKYEELSEQVMKFKLNTQTIDVFGQSISTESGNLYSTTDTDIDRQFRQAEAKLSNEGINNRYLNKYCPKNEDDTNSYKIDVILFAADDDQMKALEAYANNRFHQLVDQSRMKVLSLSEGEQHDYNKIVSDGDQVSEHIFQLPTTVSGFHDHDGQNYPTHLYLNEKNEAWIKLNSWEQGVIAEEERQPNFICWIRNNPRKSWALTIPYEMDGKMYSAYPDFIVITKGDDGSLVIDVLEPHDPSRTDNLPKAKGFAAYAANNPCVGRLQLIRQTKDITGIRYKRLDLMHSLVQKKVSSASTNEDLNKIFESDGEFMN